MTVRAAFVRLHRWIGLAIAGFLVVAGLTGSAIAFYHELDAWLNPELFTVPDRGRTIPPLELAERVAASEPTLRITYVPLEVETGQALIVGLAGRTNPETGELYESRYVEVFLNPITGARLGERRWGAWGLDRKHLMPFLYQMHYSLHLPALWGWWLMGGVAILWMVDCFVGFYLTLPRGTSREGSTFWRRWKPVWTIDPGASRYRINFDVHRAAGLWFWGVLFVLALSGVSLALHFELFRPAVSLITPLTQSPFDPSRIEAAADPGVSFASVVDTARAEAQRRGLAAPYDVFFSPEFRLFGVGMGDHHAAGLGVPYLYFDARTGESRGEIVPGTGKAGDVFLQWMFPLHSGRIAGLSGRILIAATGIVVAVLAISGVVIWWKKRQGRRFLRSRERQPEIVRKYAA